MPTFKNITVIQCDAYCGDPSLDDELDRCEEVFVGRPHEPLEQLEARAERAQWYVGDVCNAGGHFFLCPACRQEKRKVTTILLCTGVDGV